VDIASTLISDLLLNCKEKIRKYNLAYQSIAYSLIFQLPQFFTFFRNSFILIGFVFANVNKI